LPPRTRSTSSASGSRTDQWVPDELARLEQFTAELIESLAKTAPILLD
jgi:hypothetical protein